MAKSISVIDETKIEELYQFDMENKDNLLPELFKIFVTSAPQKLRDMRAHLRDKDWQSLYRSAHTLKSSAGNLGAMNLFEICAELETLANSRSSKEIKELLEEAEHQLDIAVGELTQWMGQKYATAA